MPVSTFRCIGHTGAPGARSTTRSASWTPSRVYTAGSRLAASAGGHRVERRFGEHDDASGDAGVAKRDAFLDERDGEHRGARLERGNGRLERAMAVAVSLDDRAQGRGRRDASQQADVVTDRVEIDLSDGGTH